MNKYIELANDYFGWDVPAWSQSLEFWDRYLKEASDRPIRALEIAANKGGLSLYLAQKGYKVICSDLNNPKEFAEQLHRKYRGLDIEYLSIDALNTGFGDNSFDVILFKSFLGYLSAGQQEQVIVELHRILKPNGKLVFAENLRGSTFHQFVRRNFVAWGRDWNYPSIDRIKKLMRVYSDFSYRTNGLISLFLPNTMLKRIIGPFDTALCKIIPSSFQYIIFGVSTK